MATTDEQSSNDTLTRKLSVESADLVGQTSDEDDPVYTFNKSKKCQHSMQKLTSSTKTIGTTAVPNCTTKTSTTLLWKV